MTTTVAGRPRPGGRLDRRQILTRADTFLTGWRLFAVAGAIYLAYALFVTWPLATNLSGLLSAPNLLEDAAGTASYFAALTAHHLSPFSPGHLAVWNAPQGVPVTWALNLAQAPSYLMTWVLVLVFGPIAGSNIFMLLGFVLSGLAMFAIVRRLFESRVVALFAGFAFAFYPFAIAASSVHYAFVHGWPLLLGVWACIEMVHRPTRRTGLLAGCAIAFAMWWNPYYELLGGFAFGTCLVVCVLVGHARGGLGAAAKASATALVPVAALGMFFVVLLKLGGGLSTVGTTSRPISQVYAFSAHLRDYLPGPFGVFRNLTGPYLFAHLGIDDTWDTALYPGYVVVVLAVIGLARATRSLRANPAVLADRRVIVVLTAATLAVVAFVSSLPPTVSLLGVSVSMPSGVLFHITPTWQTFARFVILLELALILMMAAALTHMRRTVIARRGLVFVLIGLLLIVDLWDRQPVRTASTTPPPAYTWLKAHPGGIVADYPMMPAYDAENARAYLLGAFDGHPLLEGFSALTPAESMKLDLADLRDPQTAAKLASWGVRYIVVHPGTPGGSPSQLRGLGYSPVYIDRHHRGSLWRVTSRPAATSVDALSGFDWNFGFPTYDWRLMLTDGALTVSARGCRSSCSGTVSFSAAGLHGRLRLTVRDQRTGAVLGRFAVPHNRRIRVSLPDLTLVHGNARLDLAMTPRSSQLMLLTQSARLRLQRH